jgi:hypothetical protein
MRKLSKDAVEEFRELYKKKMKKEISFEEAEIKAEKLMKIYMLALPLTKEQQDRINKRSTSDESRTKKTTNSK